jgi:hypothetical protein
MPSVWCTLIFQEKIFMAKQKQTAITPTREENYPEWYQQVVRAADLAENSDVRGCMVIKPWGYALWENIRTGLDGLFKATGLFSFVYSEKLSRKRGGACRWIRQRVRCGDASSFGRGS